MQRQSEKQSVVWSTVMGFVLLGGVIPVAAAEDTASALREGLESLGRVTGRVYEQELLDSIFSRFCIGK